MSDAKRLFEAIMEHTPDLVWIRDQGGRLITANAAAMRILGTDLATARGTHAADWRAGPRAEEWAKQDQHVLTTGESLTYEEDLETPTGLCTFLVVKVRWQDRLGRRGILGMSRDITERKALERAEREAREQLIALQAASRQALVDTQEQERARVSRILEESIGAELAGLLSELDACVEAAPSELRARLAQVRTHGEGLMRGLRRISRGLHPEELEELGLLAALEQFGRQWARVYGVTLELDLRVLASGVGPRCSKAIYRVVQEALTNVARHAAAKRVSVVFSRLDDALCLTVQDDGRGFAPELVQAGLGLRSIRERIGFLGGTVLFETRSDAGTRLYIRIPVSQIEA